MEDKVIQISYDVLAVLIPALVALLFELIRRKLGTENLNKIAVQLETKQDLALLAVRFVEQVYKDAGGQAKFNEALEWLSARANEHGIKITADEARGLIEAALRELKDSFGEEWANLGKPAA
ncbi:phage holin family protein [Desulfoscipio gibsoniae]|uniref:Phage holin protein (Holin_LLH) n=1 Tax=Desulfoscipio gibsoniae DSM 7213 TaxID=767817 RepID=R4KML0_9FIRM|nr:phage holin family protein [Desulfoscipio gibsoniae]AGL03919.1 Phage holin protein (Holin_LLH) [Desulfoscipio gibsoniae DSM 7213]